MTGYRTSDTRVLVFIDGQNLYKTCERLYKHGFCHPAHIANRVALDRRLLGVRYYSGVHDPTVNPQGRSRTDRRHNLLRQQGITVIERQLRYRWEWGFDSKLLPHPKRNQDQKTEITVTPYQRAREKGIDLAIGLDLIDLALQNAMDVAVIVSSDNDLCEVARATHQATSKTNRTSVEAAVFNERKSAILMQDYDYTHQLRLSDFEQAKDEFDYSQPLPKTTIEQFLNTTKT